MCTYLLELDFDTSGMELCICKLNKTLHRGLKLQNGTRVVKLFVVEKKQWNNVKYFWIFEDKIKANEYFVGFLI